VLLTSCRRSDEGSRNPGPLRRDQALTEAQAEYLARLAARADADPGDYEALKASGMAHMRFTLSGVLSLQPRAERDLEAAFALDRGDPQLSRSLGRFYNMRAVAGDDSKAAMQVEVYDALLGDARPADMDSRAFVAWSFRALGEVLSHKNRGRLMKALSTVKELEAELEARTAAYPDDIEMFALAGNFAFFFAGNLPFGKKERIEAAVGYFETLHERWDDMRPGARDPDHCPNTYENFMFELAEGWTVLGRTTEAEAMYRELAEPRPPVTRAKEQIAYVSAERLRNLSQYVGRMDLMPPWPSDVGNCVVCHSWTSDIPLDTLHSVEPITLDAIPSRAVPKPVITATHVPPPAREIVDARCVPCHRRGGEAESFADFTSDEGVIAAGRSIVRRVDAGEMPPSGPLSDEEAAALRDWLRSPGG
jgi:hypothetical protein